MIVHDIWKYSLSKHLCFPILINRCVGLGLKRPEFKQDESFVTIIWRKEISDNTVGLTAGNAAGNATGNAAGNANYKLQRIVLAIGGDTLTRDEIMEKLGLKSSSNFRDSYLYPALEQKYINYQYPDSIKRYDQAYYLTEKGLDLFASLKQS